jgi:hypothetical protein
MQCAVDWPPRDRSGRKRASCAVGTRPRERETCEEQTMSDLLKKALALFVVLGIAGVTIGCEASGEVDDDGVEIKVDDD